MRTLLRPILVACTALALALGLFAGAAATLAASPATMQIDANHTATAASGVFTAGEPIAFWYNNPDGTAGEFVTTANTGVVTAGADGSLDATFAAADWATIPLSATSIVAEGGDSGAQAVYLFGRASASSTPAAMQIDAIHTVAVASGVFTPGEPIAFWFNNADGTAGQFVSTANTGTVTAGADGSLSVTIAAADWANVPLTATSVVAHGADSGVNAVYVFPR